jgi:broad specificity polyphosphatase/5'/3'-nucleotidase SurE
LGNFCEEVGKLKQSETRIESQERGLNNLGLEVEKTKKLASSPVDILKSTPEPEKSVKKLNFPLTKRDSPEGILTKKYGENVHVEGIITITSKPVYKDPWYGPKHVADLTTNLDSSRQATGFAGISTKGASS